MYNLQLASKIKINALNLVINVYFNQRHKDM